MHCILTRLFFAFRPGRNWGDLGLVKTEFDLGDLERL